MICRCIDEGGVVGSGMGLFLIGGHWPKILPQNLKGPAKCVYCVLCTLFPPVAEICQIDRQFLSVVTAVKSGACIGYGLAEN
jgi:hypothetical protein